MLFISDYISAFLLYSTGSYNILIWGSEETAKDWCVLDLALGGVVLPVNSPIPFPDMVME